MKARGGKALLAFCAVFIALAVWAGMTWASPPVKKAKIPLAVVKAAEKDAQGRDLIETYADIDGGIMVYELRYDDGKGGWIELNYAGDGTLIEKETKIPLAQVPPQVLKALELRAPNVKINPDHIEKAERYLKYPDGTAVTLIWYEFDESQDPDRGEGKKCDVMVSAEGSFVAFEVEAQQK